MNNNIPKMEKMREKLFVGGWFVVRPLEKQDSCGTFLYFGCRSVPLVITSKM
jgi:hypothetical protein